jgi:hypothetical protein
LVAVPGLFRWWLRMGITTQLCIEAANDDAGLIVKRFSRP